MVGKNNIAWLAGLLEGEGSFICTPRKGKRGYRICVCLTMNDEDVVRRACQVAKVGYVTYVKSRNRWYWSIQAAGPAVNLMKLLLPFMGNRRSEKILTILKVWNTLPRNHCRKGLHEMSRKNTGYSQNNGKKVRRCLPCQVIAERLRRGGAGAGEEFEEGE